MNFNKLTAFFKKHSRDVIFTIVFVMILIAGKEYGWGRLSFGATAKVWHIFNNEEVNFNESLTITVPQNWWVWSRDAEAIRFYMIPHEEDDPPVLVLVYSEILPKESFNNSKQSVVILNEIHELLDKKEIQIGGSQAFGLRYMNMSNNMIWERWTIPSEGITFRTSEMPFRLYSNVWDFIDSGFKFRDKKVTVDLPRFSGHLVEK